MRSGLAIASVLAAAAIAAGTAGPGSGSEPAMRAFRVVGDAIPDPLTGYTGDAERGRRIVVDREVGNCVACHRLLEPEPFQGDLGPDLRGVGQRLTPGQIRLRVVDQGRLNKATLMPPYYRVDGLARVAGKYQGKPILSAAQIEDVVAYLARLKQ